MSKATKKALSPHKNEIKTKPKKELTWRRLGYLQLSLLIHLWQKEMYGMEIKRHLALMGYPIKENQLYPALKRLEEGGVVEAQEREVKGTNRTRIYYKLNKEGRILIGEYLYHFYGLFSDLTASKLGFVRKEILEYVELRSDMLVGDFSRRYTDTQFEPIAYFARKMSLTGRLFIMNFEGGKYEKILRERIKLHKVENTIVLLDIDQDAGEGKKTILPDNSLDLCMSIFSLRYKGTEWIIPEVARVLKPKGIIVVAASIDRKEIDVRSVFIDVMMDMSKEAFPETTRVGVDPDEIQNKFVENGLSVLKRKEKNGVAYFLFEKN
ncbi:MAG: helix-turn-helix transcriptional regulator [Candidatus Kariarchaeaceae archaeon]|jgi:DNA-binding PadR family transcriptional regulator